MSRDLQRSTNVVARALAAMHQHRSAAPSGAYQAPKPPALPAGHGFWDNSRKLLDAPSTRIQRERTALWTGSRRSVVQISSFGGNLWRERTVTFGSRGRRPEVASTANAQPLPIPAAGAPAAPGNSRKSAGEGAAPEAPGNSPSKLLPPPPVKPEWTPKPRRPSRPAAPSSRSSRPSPRRGP